MKDKNLLVLFTNTYYRKFLDIIILDFFGLDNLVPILEREISDNDVTLEIILGIDKRCVGKIILKDKDHLCKSSKQFFINFSFKEESQNYKLVYPCFWEIYCRHCLKSKQYRKKIEILGAILASENKKEMNTLLQKLHLFKENEIIELTNRIFKDK